MYLPATWTVAALIILCLKHAGYHIRAVDGLETLDSPISAGWRCTIRTASIPSCSAVPRKYRKPESRSLVARPEDRTTKIRASCHLLYALPPSKAQKHILGIVYSLTYILFALVGTCITSSAGPSGFAVVRGTCREILPI